MPSSFPSPLSPATRFRLIALLAGLVGITSLSAQDQSARNPDEVRQRRGSGQGGGGEGGAGGERRNFDPSVMRERMAGFMRDILEIEDDEEWAIIGERIEKITQLRSSATENPQFAMRILGAIQANRARGEGEDGNETGGERPTRVERPELGNGGNQARQRGGNGNSAMGGLVNALRNEASADEVRSQLETFRAAKQKNADQLSQAQEDLLMVLTPRQEAILVLAGMLP